jgi:glutamate-5-semialdehyde dehydrogenase
MASIKQQMMEIGRNAREASRVLGTAPATVRQAAIEGMAANLTAAHDTLMAANQEDLRAAADAQADQAFLKRLQITEKIFTYMVDRLHEAARLPDPLGIVLEGHTEASGLEVSRVSVPLGVIGIIYEARPNVTTDAAAVALKSGNAVILRGGSEAWRSNALLVSLMQDAIAKQGRPMPCRCHPVLTDKLCANSCAWIAMLMSSSHAAARDSSELSAAKVAYRLSNITTASVTCISPPMPIRPWPWR